MNGESWSGSLPTRRAYSRAAGAAFIDADQTTVRIGVGDDHAHVARDQMVDLEDPNRTPAAEQRQHGRILMQRAVGENERAPEIEPVAGRASEQRDPAQSQAQRSDQLVLATRQSVDQKEGEFGAPGRPRLAQLGAEAHGLFRDPPRVERLQSGDERGARFEVPRAETQHDNFILGVALARDLARGGATDDGGVRKCGGCLAGDHWNVARGRDEHHDQAEPRRAGLAPQIVERPPRRLGAGMRREDRRASRCFGRRRHDATTQSDPSQRLVDLMRGRSPTARSPRTGRSARSAPPGCGSAR